VAPIICAKGAFGYEGATVTIAGRRLRLEWYDNAILTRARAANDR
jgi:hypothetical protein